MYRHDEATRIAGAKAEGIELEKKNIVTTMHKKGMKIKQISELTDIPENKIKDFLK